MSRKLNAAEQKLHQAALSDSKKTLSKKECESLVPDQNVRMAAINFLLGAGMLKALKDAEGQLSFRAVMKKELEVKKDMSGEESMVLSHIQAAANEGIWTKHLKTKTELHQTVIDRCLKSLTQKKLIKAIKGNYKYPTRKIYMLYHLDPSVEMTGGPWYTDNEFDTEFIKLLCSACLRFVNEKSNPRQRAIEDDENTKKQPLYPISASPQYPTAQQILTFLTKSRITETQLNVEHVEMLLNVLVLDGEVEKIPAFGATMWESNIDAVREDESDEEPASKKRKRKEKEKSSKRRKRSKRSKDTDSGSESDSNLDNTSKSKKRKNMDLSDDETDRKKKKKKRKVADSDEDSGDDSNNERTKRSKKKKKKRQQSSSDSDSESGSDSSDEEERRKRKKSKSKTKSRDRSSSPAFAADDTMLDDNFGAHVYRAIKQEKIAFGLSQAPCLRCPTFSFCKDKGPVNPQECVYYGEWLGAATVAAE